MSKPKKTDAAKAPTVSASARIDVKLREEVGGFVEPREWFLVPLAAIQEAINLIRSGEIANASYDLNTANISRSD